MTKVIQIISPAGKPTGGVELLHQMAGVLSEAGYDINVLYWPCGRSHDLERFYEGYLADVEIASRIIDDPQCVTIIPETFTYLIKKIRKSQILLWWLSVDNFLNSRKVRFAVANKFMPFTYWSPRIDRRIRHAVQSEYARIFLEKNGITADYFISDYINDEYHDEYARGAMMKEREDNILYNPAKGGDRQVSIIKQLAKKYKCIPLRGMDKKTMISLLGRSKLYIDFGEHPGKDRIPREASTLGCCIITNRRGSAENAIDVPIPEKFKFDDSIICMGEIIRAVDGIMGNFEEETKGFEEYRKRTRSEKSAFKREVLDFAESMLE